MSSIRSVWATRARRVVVVALAVAAALGATPAASAAPPLFQPERLVAAKVRGGLPLWFTSRPAADGSGRGLEAQSSAPLMVHLETKPTEGDLADLRRAGLLVARRSDGRVHLWRDAVLGRADVAAVVRLARLPRVRRIALDAAAFGAPPPLERSTAEVEAVAAWRTEDANGQPLTGHGVVVCDVDTGIDVFHPSLFRADGGYFAWRDVDGDEVFTPGVDEISLDGGATASRLRVLNGFITSSWSTTVLYGSANKGLDARLDWLYADLDEDDVRDFGEAAGFGDEVPAFGEPLFVVDDVDGDGQLDLGEKLVRLGTSKIRAVLIGDQIFRRGQSLTATPRPPSEHGTASAGVIAAGTAGLTGNTGVAPDVELVVAGRLQGEPFAHTRFCVDEGARVVLHEYAPWVGHHLDGSSPLEQLIDETSAEGVAHVNPAGNLSGSRKLYKAQHAAGATGAIPIEVSGGPYRYLALSLLWRQPDRNLAVVLQDPTGHSEALPASAGALYQDWHSGLVLYAERDDSPRGTAKLDVYLFHPNMTALLPAGTWQARVSDPAAPGGAPVEVIGYLQDDVSGWAEGIHFPEGSSEDHLIGFPGTADHAIAVAAYTGQGHLGGEPGQRAVYSGRGHRIDGLHILSVSAPDDPITPGYRQGWEAKYVVFGGTSGASPHVAGAAALLVQRDPDETGLSVRDAIRKGALADAVVGAVPNDDFGYGKLRIFQSLYAETPPGGPPGIGVLDRRLGVGELAHVEVSVSDPVDLPSSLRIELDRDYDGSYEELVDDRRFAVQFDEPGTYFSKLRVTNPRGLTAQALARIDVEAPASNPPIYPLPMGPPTGESSVPLHGRGCGCVTGAGAAGRPAWLLLLLLAAAAGRRGRRSRAVGRRRRQRADG